MGAALRPSRRGLRRCTRACRGPSTRSWPARWPRTRTSATRPRATSRGRRGPRRPAPPRPLPERTVARGAAAPGASPSEPGLVEEVSHGDRQAEASRAPPARPGGRGGRAASSAPGSAPRRVAWPDARGRAHAVAVRVRPPRRFATRGRDDPQTSADRPTGLAYAAGDLWVSSIRDRRLTRIDAATGPQARADPTRSGTARRRIVGYRQCASGSRRAGSHEVVRVNARTGRVDRRIALGSIPQKLAVGPTAASGSPSDSGRRVRPPALRLARAPAGYKISVPPAHQRAGGRPTARSGSTRAARAASLRVDPVTRRGLICGPRSPGPRTGCSSAAAICGRSCAARTRSPASSLEDGAVVPTAAGRGPTQVVVAGERVFVASRNDHTRARARPRAAGRRRTPLSVGLQPLRARHRRALGLGHRARERHGHADRAALSCHHPRRDRRHRAGRRARDRRRGRRAAGARGQGARGGARTRARAAGGRGRGPARAARRARARARRAGAVPAARRGRRGLGVGQRRGRDAHVLQPRGREAVRHRRPGRPLARRAHPRRRQADRLERGRAAHPRRRQPAHGRHALGPDRATAGRASIATSARRRRSRSPQGRRRRALAGGRRAPRGRGLRARRRRRRDRGLPARRSCSSSAAAGRSGSRSTATSCRRWTRCAPCCRSRPTPSPSARARWRRRASCSRSTASTAPRRCSSTAGSSRSRVGERDDETLTALIAAPAERGLELVATGVATSEDFTRCRVLGFSHFQGEFFARPSGEGGGGAVGSLQALSRARRRPTPPSRSSSASSAPTSGSRSRCCATSTRPSSRSRARSTRRARR